MHKLKYYDLMEKYMYQSILKLISSIRRTPLWNSMEFLNKSQYWSEKDIRSYQNEKLITLLKYCNKYVPFYRNFFSRSNIKPESINIENIEQLPIIDKSTLRNRSQELISTSKNISYEWAKTSGSTGTPLHFPKSLTSIAFQLAAMYRGHSWHGVDPGEKEARLWGIPVDPLPRLKTRLIDLALNRFREKEYNLDPDIFYDFYQKLIKKKPSYLVGYTSMVMQFAKFLRESNLDATQLKLKMVKCTSEVIHDEDYDIIRDTFGCQLVSEYGAAETGLIAFQCEKGCIHIMSDCCIVEFLNQTEDLGDNLLKEVVVTNLDNTAMPIIRYKIGDLAIPSSDKCECGRHFPIINKIVGRESDIIRAKNGRSWHSIIIYYIMKGLESKYGGVSQYKVIQKDISSLEFLIVPSQKYTDESIQYIISRCQKQFGHELNIKVTLVNNIQRDKSGKLRDFISQI